MIDQTAWTQEEILWERPIVPSDWGVTKWEPPSGDVRGQLVVGLPADADEGLIKALCDRFDSQGVEKQIHGDARTLKFWCSGRLIYDFKLEHAARIIRRWREAKEGSQDG